MKASALGITDVILRDAHQSLLATRMRLEDMLPIAEKLDKVGFWSLESWGGATFDACIRYLGEDPWERIRALKKAMPNTPQQMLLRGQNLLGYRHYADDVVRKFVERAVANGVDVFRVFDAMNDSRNMKVALEAVIANGAHAQGTMSYTVSPVHTMQSWFDLGRELQDIGIHSLAIKDMAGLLRPYTAEELVSGLKEQLDIPIHMQCHATTGLSTATIVKAAEAGIDNVDTAISSMSMTYGHSPTESVVAILAESDRDTGLDLNLLREIGDYFRQVRRRYAAFEGTLRGIDSRILIAQVPGGMMSNLENQLREQNALDRLDEVMAEIPRVRKELGYIPLVTPTSQIVGTQAVFNVLHGERYGNISKETAGVLRGEYGRTPAPVDAELQARVLDEGDEPITGRPADRLEPEMEVLHEELAAKAKDEGVALAEEPIDDTLSYAMFPQVGWTFLKNRGDPAAFEPPPEHAPKATETRGAADDGRYVVDVDGRSFNVEVSPAGAARATPAAASAADTGAGTVVAAPLAGTVYKLLVAAGSSVAEGETLLIMEAMKMETEVRAVCAGTVDRVLIGEGDKVETGTPLMTIV